MRKNDIIHCLFLLIASLGLSGCEDLLGHWDKPPVRGIIRYAVTTMEIASNDQSFINELTNTGDGMVTYSSSDESVATVDANGNVTPIAPGIVTIKATVSDTKFFTYTTKEASYTLTVKDSYIYLDLSTGEPVRKVVLAEDCQMVTSTTTSWDNTKMFVVNSDVTINGKVTLTDIVNLILCDGAKLTINGQIDYVPPINNEALNIFAQSTGNEAGELSVIKTSHDDIMDYGAICCYDLTIHGGKIEFISQYTGSSQCDAIHVTYHDVTIYGGDVKAQAYCLSNDGIEASKVIISGGKLEAIGGGENTATYSNGGHGIRSKLNASGNAIVITTGGEGYKGGTGVYGESSEVSGNAHVTATAGKSDGYEGESGICSSLTVSGNATVIATGGDTSGYEKGGAGVSSLTIKDDANVRVTGGNSLGNSDPAHGGYGVEGDFNYYGGKFTIESGSNAIKRYHAICNTLYNQSDAPVSFERKKSDTDWTGFSVAAHTSEVMNSEYYIAVRKQ